MKKKNIPVTPYGQWQYPGSETIVPSGDITMDGVPYPMMGMDEFGMKVMMMPGQDYKFRGNMVHEKPCSECDKKFQAGGAVYKKKLASLTPEQRAQMDEEYGAAAQAGKTKYKSSITGLEYAVVPEYTRTEADSNAYFKQIPTKNIKTGSIGLCKEKNCADFAYNQTLENIGYKRTDKEAFARAQEQLKHKYGIEGNAWEHYGNILDKGGVDIYNVSRDKDNLDFKKVRVGDFVGLRNTSITGSAYQDEADKYGKRGVHNSHVGFVSHIDNNGNIYVEHNIKGTVYRDKITPDRQTGVGGHDNYAIETVARPDKLYREAFKNDTRAHRDEIDNMLSPNEVNIAGKRANNDTARNFVNALNYGKKDLMRNMNLNEDEADALIAASYGILGNESEFGTGNKYKMKETPVVGQLGVNVVKSLKDVQKGNIPKGAYDNSRGLTQIKYMSDFTPVDYNDPSKLDDPTNAAMATVYSLAERWNDLKNKPDVWQNNDLLYSVLKTHQAPNFYKDPKRKAYQDKYDSDYSNKALEYIRELEIKNKSGQVTNPYLSTAFNKYAQKHPEYTKAQQKKQEIKAKAEEKAVALQKRYEAAPDTFMPVYTTPNDSYRTPVAMNLPIIKRQEGGEEFGYQERPQSIVSLPEFEAPDNTAKMKSIIGYNSHRPMVNRMFNPELTIPDGKGGVMTHLMASGDGWVYPTVDMHNGKLTDLVANGINPYRHARQTGNAIPFQDDMQAREFGEDYKKPTPLHEYQEGGVSKPWTPDNFSNTQRQYHVQDMSATPVNKALIGMSAYNMPDLNPWAAAMPKQGFFGGVNALLAGTSALATSALGYKKLFDRQSPQAEQVKEAYGTQPFYQAPVPSAQTPNPVVPQAKKFEDMTTPPAYNDGQSMYARNGGQLTRYAGGNQVDYDYYGKVSRGNVQFPNQPQINQGDKVAPIVYGPGAGDPASQYTDPITQRLYDNQANLQQNGPSANVGTAAGSPVKTQTNSYWTGDPMGQAMAFGAIGGLGTVNQFLEDRDYQEQYKRKLQQMGNTNAAYPAANPLNPYGNYTLNAGIGPNFQLVKNTPVQAFEEGGEYDLSPEQIEELRAQGYDVEFID